MNSTLSQPAAPRVAVPPKAERPKRKVLHLIPSLAGGGAERFLRNLARTMAGTRWETVVLVIYVGKHEALAEELRGLGCVVHDLDEPALMNPRVWLGTWRTILAEKPDVVQTWMHHADFIGGVGSLLAGVRNVVWGIRAGVVWKNPEDSALKTRLFHTALGLASKFMPKRIIGNSETALGLHERMGYPRRKFVFIPNGIDAERFRDRPGQRNATRQELNIPEWAEVIGFVGRFHPLKELALFFQVVGELQRTRPDLHMVLCGGSENQLYPEARAAYEALPNPALVRFVPFCQEMERFYPAFDLLLMCSGNAEAFPNVILEAMACSTPVVATAGGDARSIVAGAGRVVEIGDRAGLIAACRESLAMVPAQRLAQVQRARTRAETEYTLERAAERFIEVYEEVVST